jgi:hypothetical protein
MVSFSSLLVTLLVSAAAAHPDGGPSAPKCLSDSEAINIAKRWQAIWGTGFLTKKSQLTSLVTKDVSNFDGTFGAANVGIDALFDAATFVDPLVTDVVQVPESVFHDCDKISSRWSYNAVSTGVGSCVLPTMHLNIQRSANSIQDCRCWQTHLFRRFRDYPSRP